MRPTSHLPVLATLLLVVLLIQPAPGTSALEYAPRTTQPGSSKLLVAATSPQPPGTLLADYGSFALWQVDATLAGALRGQTGVSLRDDFDTIYLRQGTLDAQRAVLPRLSESLRQQPTSAAQLWLVQFIGPIKDEWLASVRATGARPIIYMPNNAYVVWADGAALARLEQLAAMGQAVQWTGAYHPAYRLDPALARSAEQTVNQLVDVTVQFVTTSSTEQSLQRLRGLGGTERQAAEQILDFTNLSLQVPVAELEDIARQPDVFNIEPWLAPHKLDESQNQIMAGNITTGGGNSTPTGPGYLAWLASLGFPQDPAAYPIVDVVDDGLDNGTTQPLHPDFYQLGVRPGGSRVVAINNCTTDPTGNGIGGHGNLNAGIVGGYNNQPAGAAYTDAQGFHYGLGLAPYTRLASTKIFGNNDAFNVVNCSNTYQGVVAASYSAGASITSNSWGAGVNGAYNSAAQAYDALTRDAAPGTAGTQPMAHIFAAGNDGPASSTIGSPGTAKNVITVGASENVRDDGVTDGCQENSADDSDDMADFSSRGPATDGRVKPELVAPGVHVQGPASQAPGYTGTGVCNQYYPAGQTLYALSSGTSHATPGVAGAAALVHNYFGRVYGRTPSPAMLKAYLLNSARYLDGTGSGGNLPGNTQGWGGVYLRNAFDATARLLVDQTSTLATTGQVFTQNGQVASSSQPLRIALTWSDAPGSTTGNAYVNNLDLEVIIGGQTYRGNNFNAGVSVAGGTADVRNNSESVFLPAGVSGTIVVRVVAANIADDGVPQNGDSTDQDFALAIFNAVAGPSGTLQGRVTHTTSNEPISGVLVRSSNGAAVTDANGEYSFVLAVGNYSITASANGYSSQTVNNVVIAANNVTNQNFTLAGGTLRGTVRDAFGVPVAGVRVSAGSYTSFTDATGSYSLLLPAGSYTVTASAADYSPQSATLTVSDATTVTQDFVLPGGWLSGIVTNSANGQEIGGVRVQVGARTTLSDASGRYALRLPPGAYTVEAALVGYTAGSPPSVTITSGVTTTSNLVLTPMLAVVPGSLSNSLVLGQSATSNNLLTFINNSPGTLSIQIGEQNGSVQPLVGDGTNMLVVGTGSPLVAAQAALSALGYPHEAATTSNFESRSVADLLSYRGVLYLSSSGSASNTKLSSYLDAGGRLLIADNDLGFSQRDQPFYTTYLDATYLADEPDPTGNDASLVGENIMLGVAAASSDPYPDVFTPGASSQRIFRYTTGGGGAGSLVQRASYRAVYLASDLDLLGTQTPGEEIERTVLERSLNWLLTDSVLDVLPWLETTPARLTLPANSSTSVAIGWLANRVNQPGRYSGALRINHSGVPTQTLLVPVALTVQPGLDQGNIAGVVRSGGVCDATPTALAGATISIAQGTTTLATLASDAAGTFSYYLAAGSYTLTAAATDHSTVQQQVTVTAGSSITQDMLLRLDRACVAVAPATLEVTLEPGAVGSSLLEIGSSGTRPLSFSLSELPGDTTVAAQSDAAGYSWATLPAQWLEPDGGTILSMGDDGEANINLPFQFPFYDISTSSLRVGNNGAALLNTTSGEINFGNTSLSAAPNYLLAPFWDDLSAQSGSVSWRTLGEAPNRRVAVTWLDRPHYNGIGAASFQLILFESGTLLFQYRDVQFENSQFDNGASATIGIRGPNEASSTQFAADAANLRDGMALCLPRPGAGGCGDVPWLAPSANAASDMPGTPASSQQITLSFDASNLTTGVYSATLLVSSNAPQPPQAIPVLLTVRHAEPTPTATSSPEPTATPPVSGTPEAAPGAEQRVYLPLVRR